MSGIRFTIVGDSQTGKTSWLSVLNGDGFKETHQSKRLEPFTKKIIVNKGEYELEICDTLGGKRNLEERIRIYRNTDIFIICFAINNMNSFKNVRTKWYPEIKYHKPNASIVLVCTKSDLKNKRILIDEIQELRRHYYFSHVGYCSALWNINVEEIFKDVLIKLCEVTTTKKPFYHCLFVRCKSN
ncbi:ras-related protein rac-2-like [Onthophagus taurus]|uniref:ras-related protein rac-2-like n=1 Tax=Onthophagus taurus TaxID=166361 RepID=UPI0039BE07AA